LAHPGFEKGINIMAKALAAALIAMVSTTTVAAEPIQDTAKPGLHVAIVAPKDQAGSLYIPHHEDFEILFTNQSDKPLRLWDEWCSAGYATLSFRITAENGKSWIMRQPLSEMPDWGESVQRTISMAPGKSLPWKVHPGDRTWKGVPEPNTGEKITITAVFEIKPSEQSKKHRVWTGHVESAPVRVQVVNPKLRTPHQYLSENCPKQALKIMKDDPSGCAGKIGAWLADSPAPRGSLRLCGRRGMAAGKRRRCQRQGPQQLHAAPLRNGAEHHASVASEKAHP
jgi:hypothetical protein